MNRKRWITLGITGFYGMVFLLLSRYDMAASGFFTSHGNEWIVSLGQRAGPLPMTLVPAWCIMAMGEIREPRWAFRFVAVALCGAGAYQLALPDFSSTVGMLAFIVSWALLYLLIDIIPNPENTDTNINDLRLGIVITTLAFLTVQVLKFTWGRPRYVAILNDNASFSEWFRIAGFAIREDYYRSFPSGHSVGAACIFYVTLLPEMYPGLPQKKWIYWLFASCYTLFVMFSRVMAGMHFVTDVMAGCAVYLIWYTICVSIARKKGWIKNETENP